MNKIQVDIIVRGSLEKAWRFWNEPDLIPLWAFASNDWGRPHAENNLAVGGTFTIRMAAKDKSVGFDFSGTYQEVKLHEKIRYVMSKDAHDAAARTCEVTFRDMGDNTVKVTETFDAETQHSEEQQKEGWQSILNNYKRAVEAAA